MQGEFRIQDVGSVAERKKHPRSELPDLVMNGWLPRFGTGSQAGVPLKQNPTALQDNYAVVSGAATSPIDGELHRVQSVLVVGCLLKQAEQKLLPLDWAVAGCSASSLVEEAA